MNTVDKWQLYKEYTSIPKKNMTKLAAEYHIAQPNIANYIKECRLISNIAILIRVLLREMQSDQIHTDEWRSLEELLNVCRENNIEPSEGIQ